MVELRKDQDFYRHKEAGAQILLPSQMVVQSPFPELYARVKKGLSSIIVTITSDQSIRESAEGMIQRPPPSNDQLVIDIVHQGEIVAPNRGIELSWDARVVETGFTTYGWLRISYLDELSDTVAVFRVQGDGPFADLEPLWRKVMDSFSWDREKGVVLTTGDDINAHSARYAKKTHRKAATGPPLPSRMSYLQPFMDELFSLPPEDVNEDLDTSHLYQLLEKRVKGLSLAKAETRLTADRKAIRAWMEKDPDHRLVVNFVLAIIQAFEFALGERDEL